MLYSEIIKDIEGTYDSIRGFFTPEQFGVFLNMDSDEIDGNYQVVFHENFHHWQSVFTTYGHLKWGCNRSFTSEVINLWLAATENDKGCKGIPAANLICDADVRKIGCISQILVQDTARKALMIAERRVNDPWLQKMIPICIDEIPPIIELNGMRHQLYGIDILESFAKFQEATLVYLVEGKSIHETIDITTLNPEYYSALHYFFNRIGPARILEFPIICELALTTNHLCIINTDKDWKSNHPAWRFIKLIDVIAGYDESEWLLYEDIEAKFSSYVDRTLKLCAYASVEECWDEVKKYDSETGLNIPNDMLRAIEFKNKYPWALAFPFLNTSVYTQLKSFHPYYYIMSDTTGYAVDSESLGNEVMFENHYQAFAYQLCGYMSRRCIDCGRIQCGFSYYGIKGCQYQLDETCDGHLDHESELPKLVVDAEGNIVEGCSFEVFLGLMGISISDLMISDISKKIDPMMIKERVKQLHLK